MLHSYYSPAELGHYSALWLYLLVTASLFCLGWWAAAWVVRTCKIQDPGVIVFDEWAGMAITWLPVAYWPHAQNTLLILAAAFLAFRAIDLHAGFGTMLDDVFAGFWSAAIMLLLLWTGVFAN